MSHTIDPAVGNPAPARRRRSAKKSRLAVLDGLRLVAALMVVVYHYTAMDNPWSGHTRTIFPGLHRISQYGWTGVEVFFLISGFVICMSSWGRSVSAFFVSRISRLYPAYWVAVLLSFAVITVWPLVPLVRHVDGWTHVAVNMTMLQGGMGIPDVDGVYWTLFCELKFYLLFALLVVSRGVTYRNCVIFCCVWTVAGIVDYTASSQLLDMWSMPLFSPYFIAGIAFYLMYRFKPNAVLVGIVLVSFLLAENQIVKRVGFNLTEPHRPIPSWPAQVVVALAFAFMALLALGVFDRVQWRWLTTAGVLTYPLYLLHEDIGWTIISALRHKASPPVLVAGTVLAMMVLAYLLHRLVERPLGTRLSRWLKNASEEIRGLSRPAPAEAADRIGPDTAEPRQDRLATSGRHVAAP
ncbi:acyltransferase [Streptomyces sp. NPDC026206]|uniref:acyltransferase family protein n=1 Tax=Streptomyces sp. NPDC026206 TaxID=3157089 RepID=UPI0033FCC54F